jgi:hypothetical protein
VALKLAQSAMFFQDAEHGFDHSVAAMVFRDRSGSVDLIGFGGSIGGAIFATR